MEFTTGLIRFNVDSLEIVYVKRTREDMNLREEANSNLWNEERRVLRKNTFLYRTPARDARIGETIYRKNGKYIGYRAE